ncbi:ATP-dependent protease subunit HslV [Desulfobacca acetoxidans]|uniref:ATP-dependent protease subunit HslV n=1 Tax=Desulfobacca acetoxidans (strain ATCC 700848 / DSM 11109 / ASRB2) TaxID=880072 RepID=F2NDL8_DESAR|nr:ATP-dependent protease subunit HslV [Desulfobacca acetoxidans]AEB10294.1 ATP-dependent protease hslV [Desulfobacca acetoxidans DSM 11109]
MKIKDREPLFRGTTILAVRRDGKVAVAGDGQVTLNNTVMKHRARKVRKIYNGKIIVGFAGATADALSLLERFESKLEKHQGNLTRAVVELAKDWRTDKILRRLEALLLVVDRDNFFLLSGSGDVIEPDDEVMAIGSGGAYAQAAAQALVQHTTMSAEEICREAMQIAAGLCIFTNNQLTLEEL